MMPRMRIVDRALAAALPTVPRPVVRRVAERYIAGETLEHAVRCVRRLNGEGMRTTLDVLGEFIRRPDEADATAREYERVLQRIAAERLDSSVSIKLSALGMEIDPALARRHVEHLLDVAAGHGSFVRIDMEHSGLTEGTLDLYRALRAQGRDNVGVVIQSYLRRSLRDVRSLAALTPNVRVVKGIYVEPRRIAYRDMEIINRSYTRLVEELVDAGSYVAVATHDERVVYEALELLDRRGLGPDRYEFQFLLGVDEELRDILVSDGHPMRVYVPYGNAWYGYSMRRLKESPSIAGYIACDVAQTIAPG
jgi:proline dehydrogenase